MRKCIVLLFILSFAVIPFGVTQQSSTWSNEKIEATKKEIDAQPFKAKVRVFVSCDDEPAKQSLNSYVKRELRSLGDVEIVEQEEEWTIYIVVIKEHSKSGTHLGYVVGYTFTEMTPKYILASMIDSFLENPDLYKHYKDNKDEWQTGPIRKYVTSGVLSYGREGLKRIGESLVVHFDSDCLEPARQSDQASKARLKKLLDSLKPDDAKQ